MSFCIRCGDPHGQEKFPKKCDSCSYEMFINPTPVAVVVIPVKGKGYLLGKRAIPPQIGMFSFVSGYVNENETVEEAASREALEEFGVKLQPEFKLLDVKSSSNKKNVLIFLLASEIQESDIGFKPNEEVSEILITQEEMELAFPTHTELFKKLLKS